MVVKISQLENRKLSQLKELDIQEFKPVDREVVPPNKPYDRANCYLCGKELVGASKKGVVKNRNNPSF
ncbi:19952_t:CDS:2 [Entrophospora sp. SA101]|nr:12009_t:CDS:2 [Entrophospora sp. SA101]CAJ0651961.1 12450_t:CDS:2 [Entrophospora sp. SA101]CAJ0768432.1 19952_t:CDS:2 [Entrophospora sp. SA101]